MMPTKLCGYDLKTLLAEAKLLKSRYEHAVRKYRYDQTVPNTMLIRSELVLAILNAPRSNRVPSWASFDMGLVRLEASCVPELRLPVDLLIALVDGALHSRGYIRPGVFITPVREGVPDPIVDISRVPSNTSMDTVYEVTEDAVITPDGACHTFAETVNTQYTLDPKTGQIRCNGQLIGNATSSGTYNLNDFFFTGCSSVVIEE